MADAVRLLIGGPAPLYVIVLGTICVAAIVFMTYARYVSLLKWLTLSLFAHIAALYATKVPWEEALLGLRRKIMCKFVVVDWMRGLGWASTLAMTVCIAGVAVGLFT
jgi:hypothetical protein